MTYEPAEDISAPLDPPRGRFRLRLVPDQRPSEAELALRDAEAELEAVRARGPVIAAAVEGLRLAVERLAAELRRADR